MMNNKVNVKVSAEVNTILSDLYNQIEYELREDYKDTLQKQQEVLDKIKELINHYAVEDEDYSKIYNQEEKDILELLEEIE